jgi:hypothetical protein
MTRRIALSLVTMLVSACLVVSVLAILAVVVLVK